MKAIMGVIALIALAGCTSHVPSPLETTTTQAITNTAGAPPRETTSFPATTCATNEGSCPSSFQQNAKAVFEGCRVQYDYNVVERDALAKEFPPGYTPFDEEPAVLIDSMLYSCESLVLNNQTVVKGLEMLMTLAAVKPPAEAKGSDSNAYVFEMLLSEGAAVNFFESLGFPASLATFQHASLAPMLEQITIQGQGLAYEFSIAGADAPTTPHRVTNIDRLHNGKTGMSWCDSVAPQKQPDSQHAIHITANGGILGRLERAPGTGYDGEGGDAIEFTETLSFGDAMH